MSDAAQELDSTGLEKTAKRRHGTAAISIEEASGEVITLTGDAAASVRRLRDFYRNNTGTEISLDQVAGMAAQTVLVMGMRFTRSADGKGSGRW